MGPWAAAAALALAVAMLTARVGALDCDFAAQNRALLTFSDEMGRDLWSNGFEWSSSEPHCTWGGIECEDGCVVEMVLFQTGVRGVLPDIWGDLVTLRKLDLAGATASGIITGPIPPSFALLTSLEFCNLGDNAMSGSLVALESLPALREVFNWRSGFEGPLPRLETQTALRMLFLDENRLTGPIFPGYGALQALSRLDLSKNDLSSTVPAELGALPQSTFIDLSRNPRLHGVLPPALSGRGGNLRLAGTQVTIGCPAGSSYNASTATCSQCEAGFSTPADSYQEECIACGPGFAAPTAGSACVACPAGSFSDGATNTACTPCPVGDRSPPGAAECGECPTGTEIAAAEGTCAICAAGSASAGGTDRCAPCPAGTASAVAAAACTPCGPGLWSPVPESSACQQCPAGTFSAAASNTECTRCRPGASSEAGADVCFDCGPGTTAPLGGGQCVECPVGSYSRETANASCWPCPSGLVAPVPGTETCEPCGAGRIAASDRTVCFECPAGSSTAGADVATSCVPCAAGTVAPEPSTASCEPCAAGMTSDDDGVACEACPAGSSTDGEAGASCSLCPAGSAASEAGSAVCSVCEPGTYAGEPGLDVCSPCSLGSTTEGASGASSCVPCPAGSFSSVDNATCTVCAPGSFAATAGLAACTMCPAGTHQPEAGATAACLACRYPGRCRAGNGCTKGYAGAGCLFCAEDHYRVNHSCTTCAAAPWQLIVLLVLAAIILAAAAKNRLGARQTAVLKIVLFYAQLVGVALAIRVEWPSTQTVFVEAVSFASADVGASLAECHVGAGWYTAFVGGLTGPLAVVAVFWAAARLGGETADLRRLWMSSCAVMYVPLVRVFLTAFECDRNADGEMVAAGSDDGTLCGSSAHAGVQAVSGVALVAIGLVVPLVVVWFVVVRLRRRDLMDKGSTLHAWGPLYEDYCREYCFLEGVVALRKLFLVLPLALPLSVEVQSILMVVQSLAWCVFVLMRRPYERLQGRLFGVVNRDDMVNELEVAASAVIVLHQGTAGLAAGVLDGEVGDALGLVLLAVAVGLLVAAVAQTARVGRGSDVVLTGVDLTELHSTYIRAMARRDFVEAARVRDEGTRYARDTREFAAWRTDSSKVATDEAPFLDMVVAEETTDRAELEAAIKAAATREELDAEFSRATKAGHFDLAQVALDRQKEVAGGEEPESESLELERMSSGASQSTRQMRTMPNPISGSEQSTRADPRATTLPGRMPTPASAPATARSGRSFGNQSARSYGSRGRGASPMYY